MDSTLVNKACDTVNTQAVGCNYVFSMVYCSCALLTPLLRVLLERTGYFSLICIVVKTSDLSNLRQKIFSTQCFGFALLCKTLNGICTAASVTAVLVYILSSRERDGAHENKHGCKANK